jgi:hypothetical protein
MLGEQCGFLEAFDIRNFEITYTKEFEEDIGYIFDMIAIKDS